MKFWVKFVVTGNKWLWTYSYCGSTPLKGPKLSEKPHFFHKTPLCSHIFCHIPKIQLFHHHYGKIHPPQSPKTSIIQEHRWFWQNSMYKCYAFEGVCRPNFFTYLDQVLFPQLGSHSDYVLNYSQEVLINFCVKSVVTEWKVVLKLTKTTFFSQ